MIIVVDCNVVISAGLAGGLPQQLLCSLLANHQLIVTPAILEEYRGVAARPKFAKHTDKLSALIDQIVNVAEQVDDLPSTFSLPDQDDEIYLAAASTAGARYLVTGNIKHFPDSPYGEVEIVSVRDLATQLELGINAPLATF